MILAQVPTVVTAQHDEILWVAIVAAIASIVCTILTVRGNREAKTSSEASVQTNAKLHQALDTGNEHSIGAGVSRTESAMSHIVSVIGDGQERRSAEHAELREDIAVLERAVQAVIENQVRLRDKLNEDREVDDG